MEFFDSSFAFSIDRLCLVLFAALLLAAAWSDAKSYTIANRLNFAIAALYVPYVLSVPAPVDWTAALLVAAALLLIGFWLFAFGHIGGGDVKLLAASALWAGSELILAFLLLTAMAGGLLSAALLVQNRYGWVLGFASGDEAAVVPYGIAISAGGLFVSFTLLTR